MPAIPKYSCALLSGNVLPSLARNIFCNGSIVFEEESRELGHLHEYLGITGIYIQYPHLF